MRRTGAADPSEETGTETRKRGPGDQKSPPWSAERRPRSPKGNAARRKTGAPLGAPLPRAWPGGKRRPREWGRDDGLPGAAKNTGDDARLLVIPGREHSERTRNPEMQAQRVALDSWSGANAPSRNDKVRWLFEN